MKHLVPVSALIVAFYYRYEGVLDSSQAWWRIVAECALNFAVFFVIFVGGMHYLKMLSYVSNSALRMKYLLLGVLSLSWITGYNFVAIARDGPAMALFMAVMLAFLFFGPKLCDEVTTTFPLPDEERKKLVRTYPPKRLGDLSAFNVIILLVVIMPAIAKQLVWV